MIDSIAPATRRQKVCIFASIRAVDPNLLTRMTSPLLILVSTRSFLASKIQPSSHSIKKRRARSNLCMIILPPGEKSGLVLKSTASSELIHLLSPKPTPDVRQAESATHAIIRN